MNQAHFSKLKNMYLDANINTQVFDTTTCQIEEGKATISLEVAQKYFHKLNAIHGSVYFKLLDDAAFFAVNSLVEDYFVLTSSFQINFLRPVQKGILTATGSARFTSRNIYIGESTLVDQKGNEVAFGNGTFVKSKVALTPEIGYQ